jgi:hypothetical protein
MERPVLYQRRCGLWLPVVGVSDLLVVLWVVFKLVLGIAGALFHLLLIVAVVWSSTT